MSKDNESSFIGEEELNKRRQELDADIDAIINDEDLPSEIEQKKVERERLLLLAGIGFGLFYAGKIGWDLHEFLDKDSCEVQIELLPSDKNPIPEPKEES